MTKANFEELHEECSRAFTSYMKAATQLCICSLKCAELGLRLEQERNSRAAES
jgi:hypothetical protein